MKLVLGTRHWLGPDWTHMDGDTTPLISDDGRFHQAELIGGVDKVPLPDRSCSLVYSQECLEHFPWGRTREVVAEWARLVEPGGILHVEVPDFEAACRQLLEGADLELDLAMQQIVFGGQVNQWDYHYAGITHRTLPHFVEQAGLTVIDIGRGWERGWLTVVAERA